MKITVNNIPLDIHHGARVKDAIRKFYSELDMHSPAQMPQVEDGYGNNVAPDGELSEGNVLFIKTRHLNKSSFPKLVLAVLAIVFLLGCNTDKEAILFAVNDMHAEIDNFPKLAYIVDSLQAIYPDMLLIAAGDNQRLN